MSGVVIELPERESYGEVMKGYFSLMRGFGIEFAFRCDQTLVPKYGRRWFTEYIQDQKAIGKVKGRVALEDPSFFLRDLLWSDDSPLREVVPNDTSTRVVAKKIIDTRNTWLHFAEHPSTAQLEEAAALVRTFGEHTGMQVAHPAAQMIKRISKIRTGQYPPVFKPPPGPPAGLTETTPDIPAEPPSIIDVDESQPARRPPIGGTWIGDIPTRRIRVTRTGDVVDVLSGESVRDQIAGDVREKFRQWQSARPMGDLWLDTDGSVGGYVAGVPRLLGYLGPDPEDEIARGFLLRRYYDHADGHLVDLDTGVRLVDVAADDVARSSAAEVDAAVARVANEGGTIRLTNFGDLIYLDDDGMQRIAVVTPNMWFPSHFTV